jgi:4-amino-4-deoxy-L-arabinose transferase-like glycosyltransferase
MSKLVGGLTRDWVPWALIGLIVLGLCLHLWGIFYGLPYLYHPDEPLGISVAINMIKTGDLNPHFFGYGSLFFYLNAAAQLAYYAAGKLIGIFHTAGDIPDLIRLAAGVGKSLMPTQVLVGRLVSVLAGLLCILAAYGLGNRLSDRKTGLLAAVFVTLSPTMALHAVFVTPNMLATLMVMLTLLALLRLTPVSRWPSFVLVGMAFGCAVASKYNDALLILPCLVTYLFLYRRSFWKKPEVYLSLLAAGLTFLVVTPYALLDFNKFITDTWFHLEYYSTRSHAGMEGNTLEFYITYLLRNEGVLPFIGLATILAYLKRRNRNGLILTAFAVPYVVYFSSLRIRNDRTILIVLPVLLVMAADGLLILWRWLSNRAQPWRFGGRAGVAIFVIGSVIYLGAGAISQDVRLATPDGREVASRWIAANVPSGTHMAAESYAPFIDPQNYRVDFFEELRSNSPEWYRAQGYDLLVLSSGSYRRYYARPDMYPTEIAQYDAFFSQFSAVAEFYQNGTTIRILKVEP